jgi:phosphoribosyl 1,2-cyclic phosphate phosphodiesterase
VLYPPLQITFLGTGTSSGVPMIGCSCPVCISADSRDCRLRSSVLIESPETTIVIDTTPDFRYQMLRRKVKKLDAVVFTHPHKDHMAGLDDIRAFNFFSGKSMPVYANSLTEEALRRDFYYAFSDTKYPGVPELDIHTITDAPFQIQDLLIQPILTWHLKMPVLGFRVGPFTYITDANYIEDAEKEKIKGSSVLVLNALRKEHHISHFNLQQAVDLVEELQVPEAYFTHISHQMGLHSEVEAELPQGVHLSYDGLMLRL